LGAPEEELAKAENILVTFLTPQLGHVISESSDVDLRISNFDPQLLHLYSKIGIGYLYFTVTSFFQCK
jgi:hypothetical protein